MKLITGLILILTLLFTGCGKTDEDTPEAIYTAMFSRMPDNRSWNSFSVGLGEFYEEAAVTDGRPKQITFLQYTPDGNMISETSFPLSENAMNVESAYLGERGVYVIHCSYGDGGPWYLEQYSRDGALLASVNLADIRPELASDKFPGDELIPYQYNLPMAETGDGIALLWDSYVLFLDSGFAVTGSFRLPSAKAAIFDDGGIRAVYVEDDIPKIASADANGITGEKELPGRFSSGVILGVHGGFVYGSDTAGVFRWQDGMGGNAEEFCTFTPSGINGMSVRKINLLFREGADYPELQVCSNIDNNLRYTWLEKSDAELTDERITITIASSQPDRDLAQYIIDFNLSQPEIRAVLIDYSRYSTAENPDGAWMKFRMDLETGILKPDIIASGRTDNRELLRGMEGYFTDLTELMEQYPDAGITKDDIWNAVLTAYSYDGKLPALPKSIRIMGLCGPAEYLPDEHWNLEEFLDYAGSLPDGVHLADAMSRDTFDSLTGYFLYDGFVNGKGFDSPLYLRLLNYRKSLPVTGVPLTQSHTAFDPILGEQVEVTPDPYAIYREGTVRLTDFTVLGPGGILELLNQFGATSWETLRVKGYPTDADGGLRCNSSENIYMIPGHCVNREEAWSFVAYLLRSHAKSIGNPASGRVRRGVGILKSEMTAYLDTVSVFETVDKAGNVTGLELLPTADGDTAHLRSDLTAAVREGISAVYDSAAYPEYFLRTPFDLEEIIHEEEARFFGGSASAEDTAEAVRSRAGIYLAEHE